MDEEVGQRMHEAIAAAAQRREWHRAVLSGDPSGKAETIAYLAMQPGTDGMNVWYMRTCETRLTPQRLAREMQRLEVPSGQAYDFFWSLQDANGAPVGMPDQEQKEQAAITTATHLAPPGAPIAMFMSLRDLTTGDRRIEFWSPHRTPTEDLYKVLQRAAAKVYL